VVERQGAINLPSCQPPAHSTTFVKNSHSESMV
jgi:hypothetical protein